MMIDLEASTEKPLAKSPAKDGQVLEGGESVGADGSAEILGMLTNTTLLAIRFRRRAPVSTERASYCSNRTLFQIK